MTKTIIDIYGMPPVKAWNSSKSPQLNAVGGTWRQLLTLFYVPTWGSLYILVRCPRSLRISRKVLRSPERKKFRSGWNQFKQARMSLFTSSTQVMTKIFRPSNAINFLNMAQLLWGYHPLMLEHLYSYSKEKRDEFVKSQVREMETNPRYTKTYCPNAVGEIITEELLSGYYLLEKFMRNADPTMLYFFIAARGQLQAMEIMLAETRLKDFLVYRSSSPAVNNGHAGENKPVLSTFIFQFNKES